VQGLNSSLRDVSSTILLVHDRQRSDMCSTTLGCCMKGIQPELGLYPGDVELRLIKHRADTAHHELGSGSDARQSNAALATGESCDSVRGTSIDLLEVSHDIEAFGSADRRRPSTRPDGDASIQEERILKICMSAAGELAVHRQTSAPGSAWNLWSARSCIARPTVVFRSRIPSPTQAFPVH
jgi:hypothetical protein